VVNRAAFLLRYKEPALRWINEADPCHDDTGIDAESVNMECTVYLISDADGDGDESVTRCIKKNYKLLFEAGLEGWYTNPTLWPNKRTFKLFQEWFGVECHTLLVDTVGGGIYDDEI
jgi:hypothetical protein